MSIRRTALAFEGRFVQIPNEWMRDKRLSRRARGLLAEIMTHRIGWTISVNALWKSGTEGRESIRNAVNELEEHGYIRRDQQRGETGRFGEVNYVLSEPETSDVTVTQILGNGTDTGQRFTGARSTVPQEPSIKNTSPKNTIEEEAPPMTCGGRRDNKPHKFSNHYCLWCGLLDADLAATA